MSKEKWSGINPLKKDQIRKLEAIGFNDLERKISEIIKFCNETKDQCFFGEEMTVNVCNEKRKLSQGNCPYCDAENGITTHWGMSPEGFASLKKEHDNGHPDDCQLHTPIKTLKASVGDYEYFENKAVEDYKEKLIKEIEDEFKSVNLKGGARWVKNEIINIIKTL